MLFSMFFLLLLQTLDYYMQRFNRSHIRKSELSSLVQSESIADAYTPLVPQVTLKLL